MVMPPTPTLDLSLDGPHPEAAIVAPETWQRWFQHWATQVQLTGSPLGSYEVSLRLTTDAEIAELNQSFRQIDQPTDVLAFAALEQDFPLTPDLLNTEPLYLGDIVISLDTAKGQAAQAGHSLVWELAWLAAHGFLHLLGWDHPDEASLAAMMQKQYELLAALDL
jgi:probable rRNA maturation factor